MLAIRPAAPADITFVIALIRELAEYEKAPNAVVATEADLLRDGFGSSPRFHVLLAEWDGEVAGFAFYFFTYSTWRGRPCLYLEDLFVRPALRGKGIGIALMRHLAAEAMAKDCDRFVWQVLDWNEPAIRFYESLGARIERQWLTARMDKTAIAALASPS